MDDNTNIRRIEILLWLKYEAHLKTKYNVQGFFSFNRMIVCLG